MPNLLTTIYNSSLKFLSSQSLPETYQIIVEEAVKIYSAKYGSLFLGVNGILIRKFSTVPKKYQMRPRPNGNTYKAYRTGKAFIQESREVRSAHPEFTSPTKAIIYLPLFYNHQTYGVLTLMTPDMPVLSKDQQQALKLYGAMGSLAIHKTQLYEEAQKAVEMRDLFMSVASHEIKSPLTVIKTYSQILHRKAKDDLPLQRGLELILSESDRLTSLLEELLQVEQVTTGEFKYEMQQHSLTEIVNQAINMFRITRPQYQIKVENSLNKSDNHVYADANKLIQAITNILSNAAKYSNKNSLITLNIMSQKETFSMRITDKGQGIAKKDLPKIFNAFYRGRRVKAKGLGIGLYLVKDIIDRHGGTVDIQSTVNKGTTVTVTLPKDHA
jgi:signal transduction histidine kinase